MSKRKARRISSQEVWCCCSCWPGRLVNNISHEEGRPLCLKEPLFTIYPLICTLHPLLNRRRTTTCCTNRAFSPSKASSPLHTWRRKQQQGTSLFLLHLLVVLFHLRLFLLPSRDDHCVSCQKRGAYPPMRPLIIFESQDSSAASLKNEECFVFEAGMWSMNGHTKRDSDRASNKFFQWKRISVWWINLQPDAKRGPITIIVIFPWPFPSSPLYPRRRLKNPPPTLIEIWCNK